MEHSPNFVRRFRRFKADLRVKIFFSQNNQQQSVIARTYEIGGGGASVYTPIELPSDCEILLELVLPDETEPLRLGARVRNRHGFRYGLEFQDLSDPQRSAIARFCSFQP